MGAAPDLASGALHTERLDLLPLSLAFCEAIVAGDRPLASLLLGHEIGEWPQGRELEIAFPHYVAVLRADPSVVGWHGRAIVVRESDRVAGSVNLKGRPHHGRVEVGYGLLEPYQRHGYAREAAAAAIAHAFSDPAAREAVAVIDPRNTASIHVAESLGMHRTGELSSEHPGFYTWLVSREQWLRDRSC